MRRKHTVWKTFLIRWYRPPWVLHLCRTESPTLPNTAHSCLDFEHLSSLKMGSEATPVSVPPILRLTSELLIQIFSYIQADIRDSALQRLKKGPVRTLNSIAFICGQFAPPIQELFMEYPAILCQRKDGVGSSCRKRRSVAHSFNSLVFELIHMLMKFIRL